MKLARVCAELTNRVAALHQMPYLERGILSNARSKLYKDFGDSSVPHINKRNHRYIFQWRIFIELIVNKQQNDFGCLVPLFQFERIGKIQLLAKDGHYLTGIIELFVLLAKSQTTLISCMRGVSLIHSAVSSTNHVCNYQYIIL